MLIALILKQKDPRFSRVFFLSFNEGRSYAADAASFTPVCAWCGCSAPG
jgi:hypothetical protein